MRLVESRGEVVEEEGGERRRFLERSLLEERRTETREGEVSYWVGETGGGERYKRFCWEETCWLQGVL